MKNDWIKRKKTRFSEQKLIDLYFIINKLINFDWLGIIEEDKDNIAEIQLELEKKRKETIMTVQITKIDLNNVLVKVLLCLQKIMGIRENKKVPTNIDNYLNDKKLNSLNLDNSTLNIKNIAYFLVFY